MPSATTTSDTIKDDFDPTLTNDAEAVYSQYKAMRQVCPFAHTSAYGGYWALTRYEDVKAAAQNSDLFISSVKAVVPSKWYVIS